MLLCCTAQPAEWFQFCWWYVCLAWCQPAMWWSLSSCTYVLLPPLSPVYLSTCLSSPSLPDCLYQWVRVLTVLCISLSVTVFNCCLTIPFCLLTWIPLTAYLRADLSLIKTCLHFWPVSESALFSTSHLILLFDSTEIIHYVHAHD